MTRKEFLSSLAGAGLYAQATGHVVNDDHAMPRIAGVNGATMPHGAMAEVVAPAAGPLQAVATRSGSNLRYGAYTNEKRLTPAVVAGGLRKLFTMKMQGDAIGLEAQPLFMPHVETSSGKFRDLCICCTMANQVYAFDAGNGQEIWKRNLGKPVNGEKAIDMWKVNDHWGILGTGVLDNGMLYCVAWISTDGKHQNAKHVLFEVRLSNGKVARQLTLQDGALERKQRGGLTLATIGGKRTLFIPWGTIKETENGAHGFITAIDVDAWNVAAEWNSTPHGKGGGIWMAGQGLTEHGGDFFFLTGNGTFGNGDLSESFVRLRYQPGTFTVVDWWTPWMDSQRSNKWDDQDLGSASPTYIPEFKLLTGAGKDGILYMVDADQMGKTAPADLTGNPQGNYGKLKQPPIWFTFFPGNITAHPDHAADLDKFYFNKTHHHHGAPVYWEHKLYCWGENGNLRVFKVEPDGKVNFQAKSREVASPFAPVGVDKFGGMPGAMMCLSSNGDHDAVLWACVPDEDANQHKSNGRVFAFDASDFSQTMEDGDHLVKRIWMSDTYSYNKFNVPVVNGGRLYVPTYAGTVDVFGV